MKIEHSHNGICRGDCPCNMSPRVRRPLQTLCDAFRSVTSTAKPLVIQTATQYLFRILSFQGFQNYLANNHYIVVWTFKKSVNKGLYLESRETFIVIGRHSQLTQCATFSPFNLNNKKAVKPRNVSTYMLYTCPVERAAQNLWLVLT